MPGSEPTRYLVDTNILSTGAPGRFDGALAQWMDANSDALMLSVVTITEIEDGIAKAQRQGASRKAEQLASWLEAVLHLYGNRVLPIDVAVARKAGLLLDQVRGQGRDPGLAEMLIAATALTHNLTVLTRNVKDFHGCGMTVLDPFAEFGA